VTSGEAEAAARLLERLLTDSAFREHFRQNPVAASREAGSESVAEEMAMSAGKAMETLDDRESRSSLAGVFMAAALEGAGVYDFSRDLVPHLDGIPEQVQQVMSRVHHHGGLTTPAGLADVGVSGPGMSLAEEPPAPPNAAGEFPAITPEQAAAGRSRVAEQLAQPQPERASRASASDHVDPAQYGQEGHGGHASKAALALLDGKRVTFDADGIADLKAGRIDARVVSVLTSISRSHRISVSAMTSDHPKFTTGGSVSNHFYGRAVDIATVDGQQVGPGNAAARELAVSLSRLDPSIRPSEIGSPWALPGSAYFTDGGHQDHIHVAFDDPIASDWKPPEELAAPESDAEGADLAAATDADSPDGSGPDGDSPPAASGDGDAANASATGSEGEDDSDSDDDEDEDEDDASDGEQPDADDGASGDGSTGGDDGADGDHDDNSDGSSGSGGEGTDGGHGGQDDRGDGRDGGDGGAGGEEGGDAAQLDLGDVAGAAPSDTAPRADIAGWMGSEAQKRGLPAELPVMAALTESDLHNLKYGDADSLGYFQMRSGTWNQGEYAGYADKPQVQLKWFLDQADAVKRQRIAAGKPVDDPSSYGDWIADIERPKLEYRGRYQLHLDEAHDLLRKGANGVHDHRGDDPGVQVEPVVDDGDGSAGPRAVAAVDEAKKYLGTPYKWGGSSPSTGFDCSGLVQWAYAKAGIRIPRTSEQQILASNGKPVDRAHLRPGDLVFFRDAGGDVHHVGISLGGDKFLNAPHTGAEVRIDDLNQSYYAQEFAGGRRFDLAAGGEGRAAESGPGGGSAVDPDAVRRAEAALARDAAEAQRPGTLMFEAVRTQELRKAFHSQVLSAVDAQSPI
jgi:NlpC/P60 family